ncbi:hypothetical protein SLEP1_g3997 [Rubroshorea leprosula]|uniref:Uncharacterized protein n=1 Tax=Rubroshorea leprosula TaxID=152421 RepID=A0AAV5HMS4_9ROSI|nr:hypothetical protein SLEP1_g3997 [Rubroshorea leprosula]
MLGFLENLTTAASKAAALSCLIASKNHQLKAQSCLPLIFVEGGEK